MHLSACSHLTGALSILHWQFTIASAFPLHEPLIITSSNTSSDILFLLTFVYIIFSCCILIYFINCSLCGLCFVHAYHLLKYKYLVRNSCDYTIYCILNPYVISNKTNDFLCHIFHLTNFIFMFKPKNQGYLSKTFPRYHHLH